MSFIPEIIKCYKCKKEFNVVLGTFGYGIPEKCPACGSKDFITTNMSSLNNNEKWTKCECGLSHPLSGCHMMCCKHCQLKEVDNEFTMKNRKVDNEKQIVENDPRTGFAERVNNSSISYCANCIQITNHDGFMCLKCRENSEKPNFSKLLPANSEKTSNMLAEWSEEFDKKFTTNKNGHIGAPEKEDWPLHIITKNLAKNLKSFISSLLTEDRKENIERVTKECEIVCNRAIEQVIKDMLEIAYKANCEINGPLENDGITIYQRQKEYAQKHGVVIE